MTLRLNTTRALISLIDGTSQYILAEATPKSRLQSNPVHSHEDDLWFGSTILPRSLGLCGSALEILSPQADDGVHHKLGRLSPLIINDITQNDEFKDHPFAISRPSLRFYAAMPISTRSGLNIGALSVMDERPREGLRDVDIRFLDDMAVTIMAQLELTRAKEAHRRSEKMIKGLGAFREDTVALGDWWLELGDESRRQRDGTEAEGDKGRCQADPEVRLPPKRHISPTRQVELEIPLRFASPTGYSLIPPSKPPMPTLARGGLPSAPTAQIPQPGCQQAPARIESPISIFSTKPDSAHVTSPIPSRAEDQRPAVVKQNVKRFTPDFQESLISESLKDMFSRASYIIHECIEVDGAIFLDASINTRGGQKGELPKAPYHFERSTNPSKSLQCPVGGRNAPRQLPLMVHRRQK